MCRSRGASASQVAVLIRGPLRRPGPLTSCRRGGQERGGRPMSRREIGTADGQSLRTIRALLCFGSQPVDALAQRLAWLEVGCVSRGKRNGGPVFGLRATRAARKCSEKLPKPRISMRPPAARHAAMCSSITLAASPTSRLASSDCLCATRSINCDFVISPRIRAPRTTRAQREFAGALAGRSPSSPPKLARGRAVHPRGQSGPPADRRAPGTRTSRWSATTSQRAFHCANAA